MYSRYGHVNHVFVKVGDKVKKGQKIATNGTGNGQWAAHLHRDHPIKFPLLSGGAPNYGFYNIGWTREKTKEFFVDPHKYPKGLGSEYDHAGYDWLEKANYGTAANPKWCWHPGLDENGKGSGNADYDDPVYAVADGIVLYAYTGNGTNGGWGHLIVIEETKEEVKDPEVTTTTTTHVMGETTTTSIPVVESPVASNTAPEQPKEPEVYKVPVRIEKTLLARFIESLIEIIKNWKGR